MEANSKSPTFVLEYWWMGQKAEEQRVSTVKTSTLTRERHEHDSKESSVSRLMIKRDGTTWFYFIF